MTHCTMSGHSATELHLTPKPMTVMLTFKNKTDTFLVTAITNANKTDANDYSVMVKKKGSFNGSVENNYITGEERRVLLGF